MIAAHQKLVTQAPKYEKRKEPPEEPAGRLLCSDRGRSPSRPALLSARNPLPQPEPTVVWVGPRATASGTNGLQTSHPGGTPEHYGLGPADSPDGSSVVTWC